MTTRNCSERPPHCLLAELRRKGLRLSEEHGRLKVTPKAALTQDLRNTVASSRDGLLSALSVQNRLLRMSLGQFEHEGRPIEVVVPGLPTTLWFVPDRRHADMLVMSNVSRGRIWTARELMDVLKIPGLDASGAATIARAKAEFGAEVISVTPDDPGFARKPAAVHPGEGRSG